MALIHIGLMTITIHIYVTFKYQVHVTSTTISGIRVGDFPSQDLES